MARVVLAADKRHPEALDKLLNAVEHDLEGLRCAARHHSWRALARRQHEPMVAVREIADRTRSAEPPSPRDAEPHLESLRGAVLDVRAALKDESVHASLLAYDQKTARKAGNEITGACRRALSATDALLTGIDLANDLLSSRRAFDGPDVTFRGEHNVVRALIDDREDVAVRMENLLEVLRVRVPTSIVQ